MSRLLLIKYILCMLLLLIFMDDRLQKFASVVDCGSFTKAAHENHVSQPALSAAVSKLERELHAKLLTRKGKAIELTEAGKFAYATAKELNVQTNNLVRKIAELDHDEPAVALGMIDSVANALFASEAAFGTLNQVARLSVVVNNSRYLLRAIERDEIDLAFTTHQPAGRLPSLLETTRLASEAMPLICHPDNRQTVTNELRLGRLANFISYDQASTTYYIVSNSLKEIGIQPEVTFSSSSPEVILRLVLLKKGAAVLPYISVKEYLRQGRLAAIGHAEPITIKREIGYVHRRDKALTPTLMQIITHIQGLISDGY